MEITQEEYNLALEKMQIVKERMDEITHKLNVDISNVTNEEILEHDKLRQLYSKCLIIKIIYESKKMKEGRKL